MAQPLMRLFMHEDRSSAAGIILLGHHHVFHPTERSSNPVRQHQYAPVSERYAPAAARHSHNPHSTSDYENSLRNWYNESVLVYNKYVFSSEGKSIVELSGFINDDDELVSYREAIRFAVYPAGADHLLRCYAAPTP